jgi:Zn-dependent peptidase ImmA (M78 family)
MVHLKKYDIQFKKQTFIVVFDADIMRTHLLGTAKGMLHDDLVYVKINPREWGRLSHKQRRHTIFHELSHDLFNTEHTFEIELMKPAIPTDAESFAMDIEKAIDELMKYIKNGR